MGKKIFLIASCSVYIFVIVSFAVIALASIFTDFKASKFVNIDAYIDVIISFIYITKLSIEKGRR